MPSNWDVDSYKTDFESEEHWELRRNFMLAHKDKLPEDEIVCLAQVFTNIELLGCRYPEETMQKVAELAKGVVEAYREKKKSCLKRTFVAASDAAVAKVKGQASFSEIDQPRFSETGQPRISETDQPRFSKKDQPKFSEPNQPRFTQINLQRFPEINQPRFLEINQSRSEIYQPRFSEINQPRFPVINHPRFSGINLLRSEISLPRPEIYKPKYSNLTPLRFCKAGEESGKTKKKGKKKGKINKAKADKIKAEKARLNKAKAEELKEDNVNADEANSVSNMGFVTRCIWDEEKLSGRCNCHGYHRDDATCNKNSNAVDVSTPASNFNYNLDPDSIKRLNDLKPRFVLFLYDEPPVNLLERNASLNKGILRWHFDGQKNLKSCSVYFNGILLGTSEKCPKKQCKEIAARQALKNLQGLCYTVKIKQHVKCVNKVTPAALGLGEGETMLKSHIGEQIMKLMGWSGGGLGVKQQGIIQPISIFSNTGRDGLGLTRHVKQDRGFRNRANTFLRNWLQTDSDEDLVFSTDFTPAQRETLHKLAADLNLKSRSYGKNKDRYIVIYKKPVPWLIVEKLVRMGGSTNRYELVVPTVTIS